MKATKFVLALAAALVVLLSPRLVLADSYSSFTVTGTLLGTPTLSGTITIDTTTGVVTTADLTWAGISSPFTTIETAPTNLEGYPLLLVEDPDSDSLGLAFPNTSLVGYSGVVCVLPPIRIIAQHYPQPWIPLFPTWKLLRETSTFCDRAR